MHGEIDNEVITKKYESKLDKIDHEIAKLDSIIKNGCGKIVERPVTSRISINSATHFETELKSVNHIGTDWKRESEEETPSRNTFLYL
jgi:hypothetical protein